MTLFSSPFPLLNSSQLVLTHIASVQLVQLFLSPVEATEAQTCSTAFPFPLLEKLLHRSFYTHRNFCTEYKHGKLLHRASFCTEKLLHRATFYTRELLHTETLVLSTSVHTEKLLHTACFYTEKLSHRESATQEKPKWRKIFCQSAVRSVCGHYNMFCGSQLQKIKVLSMQLQQRGALMRPSHCDPHTLKGKTHGYTNCSSKTGPRRQNGKTTILKGFCRKIISAKMEKNLLPKHHLQTSCSHYNKIYYSQLQKTIVFCTRPQQQGTSTQPFH